MKLYIDTTGYYRPGVMETPKSIKNTLERGHPTSSDLTSLSNKDKDKKVG